MQPDAGSASPGLPLVAPHGEALSQEEAGARAAASVSTTTETTQCEEVTADAGASDPAEETAAGCRHTRARSIEQPFSFQEMLQAGLEPPLLEDIFLDDSFY